jgi:hypothetical protein
MMHSNYSHRCHKYSMLYINNKYTKIYWKIIHHRIETILPITTYQETHHIIPKSLGGSNKKENLVKLTAREHFICHWLLTKMVNEPSHKASMQYAFFRMSQTNDTFTNQRYKVKSHHYEIIRKNLAEAASHTHTGRIHSVESKEKRSQLLKGRVSPTKGMVAWNKGIPTPEAVKTKLSESLKGRPAWNKGIAASEDSNIKRKAKQSNIPKQLVECPYCNKVGGKPAMTRHHFDNCKLK